MKRCRTSWFAEQVVNRLLTMALQIREILSCDTDSTMTLLVDLQWTLVVAGAAVTAITVSGMLWATMAWASIELINTVTAALI